MCSYYLGVRVNIEFYFFEMVSNKNISSSSSHNNNGNTNNRNRNNGRVGIRHTGHRTALNRAVRHTEVRGRVRELLAYYGGFNAFGERKPGATATTLDLPIGRGDRATRSQGALGLMSDEELEEEEVYLRENSVEVVLMQRLIREEDGVKVIRIVNLYVPRSPEPTIPIVVQQQQEEEEREDVIFAETESDEENRVWDEEDLEDE